MNVDVADTHNEIVAYTALKDAVASKASSWSSLLIYARWDYGCNSEENFNRVNIIPEK